jgi:dihydroxyacid dehydratase/phosphogluconate dehydratase
MKGGQITLHDFLSAEAGHSRSAGTCNTMGTASTMACMAEALGTSLPHNAAIPAVDARRYVLAHIVRRSPTALTHRRAYNCPSENDRGSEYGYQAAMD